MTQQLLKEELYPQLGSVPSTRLSMVIPSIQRHEVLIDSLVRQIMHYKDGAGKKPSNILGDQHGGIVGTTRAPEFVNKYPHCCGGTVVGE